MNDTQFLTYQKFNDKLLANELAQTLTANNVEFVFEDSSPHFDPSFANNETSKEYLIKLQKPDFEKADEVLMNLSAKDIDAVSPDHYLFNFTDDELKDLLLKSDEWSKYDYLLAQKILDNRGYKIDEKAINKIKEQRIEELSKAEKSQKNSIIAGYIFAVLGGLIAVFIGWDLFSHKKTLPNGERVYSYSEHDRKQGKIITVIGVLFVIIWTIFRLINS
ncbi:hypothetical protein ACVWYG_003986 [Pedobacter sp. UYEF25]